jgi:hypothetical protein
MWAMPVLAAHPAIPASSIARRCPHRQEVIAPACPKLRDQVRAAIRLKHYPIRTEAAYVPWIKRFELFHNKRHPNALGAAMGAAFLTPLAVADHGSTSLPTACRSTRAPALCAATTPLNAVCNNPFARRPKPLASPSASVRIPFAPPSPPTCPKMATTSALSGKGVGCTPLLGHKDAKTTMISTHVLQRSGLAVRIPLDG